MPKNKGKGAKNKGAKKKSPSPIEAGAVAGVAREITAQDATVRSEVLDAIFDDLEMSPQHVADEELSLEDLQKKVPLFFTDGKLDIEKTNLSTILDLLEQYLVSVFKQEASNDYSRYNKVEFLFQLAIYKLQNDNHGRDRIANLKKFNNCSILLFDHPLMRKGCLKLLQEYLTNKSSCIKFLFHKEVRELKITPKKARKILGICQYIESHRDVSGDAEESRMTRLALFYAKGLAVDGLDEKAEDGTNDSKENLTEVKKAFILFCQKELGYYYGKKSMVDAGKLRDFMVSLFEGTNPLQLALNHCDDLDILRFTLDLNRKLGIDINEKNNQDVTLLHEAIVNANNSYEKCEEDSLKRFSIDIESVDKLELAVRKVGMLLDYGALVSAIDKNIEGLFNLSDEEIEWAIQASKVQDIKSTLPQFDFEEKDIYLRSITINSQKDSFPFDLGENPSFNINAIGEMHDFKPDSATLIMATLERSMVEGYNLSSVSDLANIFDYNLLKFLTIASKMCDDSSKIDELIKRQFVDVKLSEDDLSEIDQIIANGQGFELGAAAFFKVKNTVELFKGTAFLTGDEQSMDLARNIIANRLGDLRKDMSHMNGEAATLLIAIFSQDLININLGGLESEANITLVSKIFGEAFKYFKNAPCTKFNEMKFAIFSNFVNTLHPPHARYLGGNNLLKRTLDGFFRDDGLNISFEKALRVPTPSEYKGVEFYKSLISLYIKQGLCDEVHDCLANPDAKDYEDEAFRSNHVILLAIYHYLKSQTDTVKAFKEGQIDLHEKMAENKRRARIIARFVNYWSPCEDDRAMSLLEDIIKVSNADLKNYCHARIQLLLRVGFLTTDQVFNILVRPDLLELGVNKEDIGNIISVCTKINPDFLTEKEIPADSTAEFKDIVASRKAVVAEIGVSAEDSLKILTEEIKFAIVYCNSQLLTEKLGELIDLHDSLDAVAYKKACLGIAGLGGFINPNFESERINLVIASLVINLEKAAKHCEGIDLEEQRKKLLDFVLKLKPMNADSIIFTIEMCEMDPFEKLFDFIVNAKIDFQNVSAKTTLLDYLIHNPLMKSQKIDDDTAHKIIKLSLIYLQNSNENILKKFFEVTGYKLPRPDFKSPEICAAKEMLLRGLIGNMAILVRNNCKGGALDAKEVEEFLKKNSTLKKANRDTVCSIISSTKNVTINSDGLVTIYDDGDADLEVTAGGALTSGSGLTDEQKETLAKEASKKLLEEEEKRKEEEASKQREADRKKELAAKNAELQRALASKKAAEEAALAAKKAAEEAALASKIEEQKRDRIDRITELSALSFSKLAELAKNPGEEDLGIIDAAITVKQMSEEAALREIVSLKNENHGLQEQEKLNLTRIQNLEDALAAQKSEYEKMLAAQQDAARETLAAQKEELERQLSQQKEDLSTQIAKLNQQIEEGGKRQVKTDSVTSKAEQKRITKEALAAQKKDYEEALAAQRKKHQGDFQAALVQQKAQIEAAQNAQFVRSIAEAEAKHLQEQRDLEARKNTEIQHLHTELARLQGGLALLQGEITRLQGELAIKNGQLANQGTRITELQAVLDGTAHAGAVDTSYYHNQQPGYLAYDPTSGYYYPQGPVQVDYAGAGHYPGYGVQGAPVPYYQPGGVVYEKAGYGEPPEAKIEEVVAEALLERAAVQSDERPATTVQVVDNAGAHPTPPSQVEPKSAKAADEGSKEKGEKGAEK